MKNNCPECGIVRRPSRNFAVAPSVEQLAEMYIDIPCDASGEAEPHDPGCDCDACVTAAEAQQDEHIHLRIADGDV